MTMNTSAQQQLNISNAIIITLIPKKIGNRKKRWCVRFRSEEKHNLRKSADRKAQIRKAYVPLSGLICAFQSADFLRWFFFSSKRNLTHNLFFLFPIVFGINLIHFLDEKKDGAAGNEECELFRRVQRFWQRKVWTQRHFRGEKLRCKFLARKSAKLFANFGVLARKSANFFANISATKVTSLSSISLSLSFSLYLSLSLTERTSRRM